MKATQEEKHWYDKPLDVIVAILIIVVFGYLLLGSILVLIMGVLNVIAGFVFWILPSETWPQRFGGWLQIMTAISLGAPLIGNFGRFDWKRGWNEWILLLSVLVAFVTAACSGIGAIYGLSWPWSLLDFGLVWTPVIQGVLFVIYNVYMDQTGRMLFDDTGP